MASVELVRRPPKLSGIARREELELLNRLRAEMDSDEMLPEGGKGPRKRGL